MFQDAPAVDPSSINCVYCGYNLTGVAIGSRCPECGAAVDGSLQAIRSPQTSGAAITSLVLGIVSIVVCGLAGPVAILFGVRGIRDARSGRYTSSALVLSIIGISLGALATLLTLAMLAWVAIDAF